jgi:hypothetical protein
MTRRVSPSALWQVLARRDQRRVGRFGTVPLGSCSERRPLAFLAILLAHPLDAAPCHILEQHVCVRIVPAVLAQLAAAKGAAAANSPNFGFIARSRGTALSWRRS